MSLPTKTAAAVLGQLPPRYIEAISVQIAQTDSVGGDDQEVVIAEFLTSKASSLYASPGGLERAKELIKEALGRDATRADRQPAAADRGDAVRLYQKGRLADLAAVHR